MTADVLLTPEEWAASGTEVALLGTDPTAIERADPEVAAAFVTKALEESKSWLHVAMQRTDPTEIADFKAWAATVEAATRQKKLGREIELDAAEMVRRAERGIGVAVRRGQEAGTIRKPGDDARTDLTDRVGAPNLVSPSDVAREPRDVLSRGIYPMTDDVSDEQFDAVLTEAKAEGNLSRANVVRKVKGEPTPKSTDRPEHLRKMRRHDPNRIVEQTVIGLEGYVLGIALIDFDGLDRAQIAAWSGSLATSLQSLNRLSRRLKELDQA